MLTRRSLASLGAMLLGIGLFLAALGTGANADGGVGPCGDQVCVGAGSSSTATPGTGGGTGGTGGGGGGGSTCTFLGTTVPCYVPGYGWWDGLCYDELADPQPPTGDPSWEGHQPGDGAVYRVTCIQGGVGGVPGSVLQWMAAPPPGFGGGPSPQQLAQQAEAKMLLSPPSIGKAPKAGATGLVGLPVWVWDVPSQTTWGPNSASATAGGMTVTAVAKVASIVWSFGDGTSLTCTSPGTPYSPSYGNAPSPTCGSHVYQQTSAGQGNGLYTIQATSTWTVTWTSSTGVNGTLNPLTRTSTTSVAVGQLQALNQ